MLTRCPHCRTQFRVTAEQLKIRQGKVRCGSCRQVFDAIENLIDEIIVLVPETPALSLPNPATIAANENPALQPETPIPAGPEAMPAPEPEPAPEPAPAPVPGPEPEAERRQPEASLEAEFEAAAPAEPERASEPAQEPEPPAEPASAEEEAPAAVPAAPPRTRRWPWIIGIVILSLLMAGQILYIFRSELAVISPELRPFLVAACETFGCTLPRPVRPELVGIEASDLVPDGGGLRMTATLKNRAPFAQDYPHLELTLTDTQDAALVRKVLAPADYLPAGRDAAAGFPAQSEITLDLRLTTDDVPAVGYRLYLFYP